MKNGYQTINDSELDDFRKACQENKLNPDDFTLIESDVTHTSAGNGLTHPNGKVTISKKRNGKSKIYATGNQTHWPIDFENDLKTGAFN